MKRERYVLISKCRLQVGAFVDRESAGTPEFDYIVDLQDHPQKDEVQIDWFYDPAKDTFSSEGEIPYPEPESTVEQQLTLEQAAILETANNVDYLVCLKDLGL